MRDRGVISPAIVSRGFPFPLRSGRLPGTSLTRASAGAFRARRKNPRRPNPVAKGTPLTNHTPRLDAVRPPERVIALISHIATAYGVAPEEILGPSRGRFICAARDEVCYLLRLPVLNGPKNAPSSIRIGTWLGGRDSSSVRVAGRRHEALIAKVREASEAQRLAAKRTLRRKNRARRQGMLQAVPCA